MPLLPCEGIQASTYRLAVQLESHVGSEPLEIEDLYGSCRQTLWIHEEIRRMSISTNAMEDNKVIHIEPSDMYSQSTRLTVQIV